MVSIFTSFGREKPWVLSVWLESIKTLELEPKDTELLLVDNSFGDVPLLKSIQELIEQGFTVKYDKFDSPLVVENYVTITAQMVKLWQRALAIRDTSAKYLFSLEQDIGVKRPLWNLISLLEELPQAGIVAWACRSRQYGHYFAYPLVSMEPFLIGNSLYNNKPIEVGATCTGCTLFKKEVVDIIVPRQLTTHRHEDALCHDAIQAGYKIYVDFGSPTVKHYKEEEQWLD